MVMKKKICDECNNKLTKMFWYQLPNESICLMCKIKKEKEKNKKEKTK